VTNAEKKAVRALVVASLREAIKELRDEQGIFFSDGAPDSEVFDNFAIGYIGKTITLKIDAIKTDEE
jgi:hypothetical protein